MNTLAQAVVVCSLLTGLGLPMGTVPNYVENENIHGSQTGRLRLILKPSRNSPHTPGSPPYLHVVTLKVVQCSIRV